MNPNNRVVNNTGFITNQESILKLATLNVPKFSCEYKEWSTFHDMFMALIHSNETLTDVQQYFYLKFSLIGDAKRVIQYFKTIIKNYQITWKFLNDRYNNKCILVQNHTRVVFELKFIIKESALKLR